MEKISQEIIEENADGTFGLDLLVNKSKKKSDTKDENISDINSIEKISENIENIEININNELPQILENVQTTNVSENIGDELVSQEISLQSNHSKNSNNRKYS